MTSRTGCASDTIKDVSSSEVGSPTNSTNEDTAVSGSVLDGASDSEGHTITATPATDMATTAGGKVTILSDGSYTYTPAAGYEIGRASCRTIQPSDGDSAALESSTGTVNLTVNEHNDLVVCRPTSRAHEDTAVSGSVLDGASDSEGHTITATPATDMATTAGGKVTILSDGSYTYTPAAGY